MYADSWRRYFKNFDPSSFRVVPNTQAVLREAVKYAEENLSVGKWKGVNSKVAGGNKKKTPR